MRKKFEEATINYMGCEGGDPRSDIWLCGMEHGGQYSDAKELGKAFDDAIDFEIRDLHSVWSDMVLHRHGQHFAALIESIKGSVEGDFSRYKDKSDVELKDMLGTTFKMNLYPLAFKSLDNDALINEIGFDNKDEYREWVEENRFEQFSEFFNEHKPKILLCAGLGMEPDFKRAFFPESSSGEEGHVRLDESGRKIRFVHYSIDSRHVFVIPGLTGGGGYCLTSYDAIKKVGAKISEISGI